MTNKIHLTVILVVTVTVGTISSSTLDTLREACPYTNFCTVNSTKTYTPSNDTMPCCYDCFCDDYCSLLGDCCPDQKQNKNKFNRTKLECKENGSKRVSDTNSYFQLPRFRFIDFCPDDFTGDSNLIDSCKGNLGKGRELDDIMLVSDQDGRLFRNKHCAECHGATSTSSWELSILYCLDNIDSLQLTASEAQKYILENCTIVPVRPRNVPVTARTLQCYDDDVQQCSTKDEGLKDACINGPYMPYIEKHYIGYTNRLHRNVFCLKCNDPTKVSGLCSVPDDHQNRNGDTSYGMLLKADALTVESSKQVCEEFEAKNPYTGACQRLYCPPFHVISHGKCIPLSSDISDFFVTVNVVYTLVDVSESVILDDIVMYDDSVQQYYLRRIQSKYSYPNCRIMRTIVTVHTEKTNRTFVRLLLEIIYEVTTTCPLQLIGKRIQKQTNHDEKENWLLNDKTFKMMGHITFYQDPPLYGNPLFFESVVMVYSNLPVRFTSVTTFFVCPYFILSLKEYMDHVKSLGITDKRYKLNYFAPDPKCIQGFFPLKQNEVAACFKTYRAKNNGRQRNRLSSVYLYICLVPVYLLSIYISF